MVTDFLAVEAVSAAEAVFCKRIGWRSVALLHGYIINFVVLDVIAELHQFSCLSLSVTIEQIKGSGSRQAFVS